MSFFGTQFVEMARPTQRVDVAVSRAALIVYRQLMGQPHFLLISARRDANRLTLPGGMVDKNESAIQSAIRETLEESGVLTDRHQFLGLYQHQKTNGKVYPTQTFIARYAGYQANHEKRSLHWLTVAELRQASQSIRQAVREQVELAADALPAYIAAA